MVQEINTDMFDMEVLNHDGVTVVDFFANWCGPCRKLGPVLDEIAGEYIEAAKKYQVSGLPTLLVFKDGEVVERMVGLMPKSTIITNIEKHL